MSDARWHVHGLVRTHLVLYHSVEEGPLAELACYGDVDPTEIADALNERALLRRVLSEYLAGNRIVNGHWYSPDECGEAHNINDRATAEEVALIDSLKAEVGL